MKLADLPYNTGCTIHRVGDSLKKSAYQLVAGIVPGNFIRVLARYPAAEPRFIEVEVAHTLVLTLPLSLALDVSVECSRA